MKELDEELASIASRYSTDLFARLDATQLTADWVRRFDANFRLRTLLTIPEVFCTGISVANYLDFAGIAAAGSIVADETGVSPANLKPNAQAVHSVLLTRAFDSLRRVVFAIPALDAANLLCMMRVLDRLALIESQPDSVGERWTLVRADLTFARLTPFDIPVSFSDDVATDLAVAMTNALLSEGVTKETITYCHSQYRMQRCDNPARVIGRALMHEFLADGMLTQIEESLFLPFRDAWEGTAYDDDVAPYFLAHRNQLEGSFVELEHAERMRAIATPFMRSPLMRQPLLDEAVRFAVEQRQLFDSLTPASPGRLRVQASERTASP